jgi:hypothetical protein
MSEANSALAANSSSVKRHGNFRDLTGQQFYRLKVISRAPDHACPSGTYPHWHCICACGKEVTVLGRSLKSGHTKSCGCLHREVAAKRRTTHGHTTIGIRTRTYQAWGSMIKRCTNSKCRNFHNYGGRGIKVCDRWRDSYANFLADIGECPPGLQIERCDNDGNYEPSNCRWTSKKAQSHNRRTNHLITIDGETLCVAEWSERSGNHCQTIVSRLRLGWDAKRAVFQSVIDSGTPSK